MNSTNNAPSTSTSTALAKYVEADVRAMINAGQSVPKDIVKLAPKGAIAAMRLERKAELMNNSETILGQFKDKGFRLAKVSEVVTRKDGRQVVSIGLETRPVKQISDAEAADVFGCTPEQFRAALNIVRGK